MAAGAVQSVEVEGHTSIRAAVVELGQVNVLVGANGAGKSNFIRALELLGRIVDGELGLFVRSCGGAGMLLHRGVGVRRIRLKLNAPPNTYEAVLVPALDDRLYFESESCSYQGSNHPQPYLVNLGSGHDETRLHAQATGDRPGRMAAEIVIEKLRRCRVFHFHDTSATSAIKDAGPTGDSLSLHGDARNVAAVLARLRDSDQPADTAAYRRISGIVRLVAPFFREFVLQPESFDRIRLRWRDVDTDTVFSAHQMSDGTLRFVCLATLLLQPHLPAVVVLDEPELGLHPYAITQLAGLLRQAAVRSQVLMATQSVTLINEFQVGDIIVVERGEGSVFGRPDPAKLSDWLEEYSLGDVWQMNLFGGRPGPAGRGIA